MLPRAGDKAREQPLLWLFPGALILAVYAFGVALPTQRHQSQQLDDLARLRAGGASAEQVQLLQANVAAAQRDVALLKSSLASARQTLRDLSWGWRSQESRLETVREITKLAKEHQLSVLTQQFETKQQLSEHLQQVVHLMELQTPEEPLEYWQVQLGGRYRDMSQFLSALDTTRVKMIPVLLTMRASLSNDGIHLWTVVFIV